MPEGNRQGIELASLQMTAIEDDSVSDAGPIFLALGNAGDIYRDPRLGIWARGFGTKGNHSGDDIASQYEYTAVGTALGMDYHLGEDTLAGVGMGYTHTTIDLDNLNDSGRSESYHTSLYASYTPDPWFIKGIFSYGFTRYITTRSLIFGTINRVAEGDHDGHEYSGYLEGGYVFEKNKINLRPAVSCEAIYLYEEGYTETGADSLNLVVDGRDTTSMKGSLGLSLDREFVVGVDAKLIPDVHLGWTHEFSGDDHLIGARFSGSETGSFTMKGDRPRRDTLSLGVGLNGRIGDKLSLETRYDADINGDHTVHSLTAGLRYMW